MKRIIFLVLVAALTATICYAAMTNPASSIDWGNQSTYSNLPDNKLKAFCDEVEASVVAGGTLISGGADLTFEGATADAYEAIIRATDPTADTIWTIPVAAAGTYSLMSSTLATNAPNIANSVWGGTNQLIFEGATADAYETIITPTDATADRTITIPDKTGQVQLASAAVALTLSSGNATLTVGQGNLYTYTVATDNQDGTITFSGAGTAGDVLTILFITDTGGSGDEAITFHGTLVSSVGGGITLANATAKAYTVSFISNGSKWYETARTAIHN